MRSGDDDGVDFGVGESVVEGGEVGYAELPGLLAQGLDLGEAAPLGVYLHGLAGERVRREVGDTGMLAGDLLPALPRAIRELRRGTGG